MNGDDLEPGDLEPIDLEPIDLEPVDLEPGDDLARFDRETPRPRARGKWLAVAVVGLGAWAAIALTTRGHHTRQSATATTTTTVARVDPVVAASSALRAGLESVGIKHFATVIDDRLYVLDSLVRDLSLVPLPEGHVAISDQNGSSLFAATFQQTLVWTDTNATRLLSVRETAIRSVTPARWWVLRDDATIRSDLGNVVEHVPAGLRVVAAIPGGFLAQSSDGHWVVWSHSGVTPIAPVGQFLAAGPHAVAFMTGCGYSGCSLQIYDPVRKSTVSRRLYRVPQFAAFSPDGNKLAFASTQGDVELYDAADGTFLAQITGNVAASPTVPFSWTADSRRLLVVQDGQIAVVRAADGATTNVITATRGVEQVFVLP